MGKDSAAGAGRGSGTSEGPRGPQIKDSPPAFYGMHLHLVLDEAQVTDMHSAAVLCDREGNALAAVSGDGMLIEVYNTAGELIVRLNRSADLRYVITSAAAEPEPPEVFCTRGGKGHFGAHRLIASQCVDPMVASQFDINAAALTGKIYVGETEEPDIVPVALMWRSSGGGAHTLHFRDETEVADVSDFSELTLIQRLTMAVRLRTIASALSGDRR